MLPDAVENIDEDQKQGDEHGHPENEVSDVVSNGIYGDGVHNIELSAAEATHPQFPVSWEIQPSQNKYLCFFVLLYETVNMKDRFDLEHSITTFFIICQF